MINLINLIKLWNSIAITISFAITVILGKFLIPVLIKFKYGQSILKIGPSWHEFKQGTPTMGGLTFMAGILISSFVCMPFYYFFSGLSNMQTIENNVISVKLFAGLFMSFFFGMIGFIDDFVKIRNKCNLGLTAKQKLVMQILTAAGYLSAVAFAEIFYSGKPNTFVNIPFLGNIDFGLFYWPFAAIIIVGIVNAVNLTDGVDGLCSGISLIVGISYIIITKLLLMFSFSIQASALTGGCLGFLVWNFHPAKIFMGDTGSLFLGGIICALGFGTGNISLLILVSFVYIVEMLSVITQVIYYKLSHGKRLFKMSPIHHHFEIIGFKETKICITFMSAAFIFSIIAIVFLIFGII